MKTAFVIYTDFPATDEQTKTQKRYVFNFTNTVKEGDRLETDVYSTALQVVEVLPKQYNYVNKLTGELTVTRQPNTNVYPIREIRIDRKVRSASVNVIDARLI